MRMKLLIICICQLTYANAATFKNIGDKSFFDMCQFWGGSSSDYKERFQGYRAMTGDTCSMSFPVGMEDEETAMKYCEDNVPFHIRKVEIKKYQTICRAEATLKCDDGWVQMFGRCYKIQKKMITRDHAKVLCKSWKPKATIAFMHRETLPFRVRDYFTDVSRVWMDASETVTNVLEYKTGPNLLLAIDGYKYALPNLAFAQVPTEETAMTLCEYTPDMTQAESNWLLGRYGEIYYPPITTSDRTYVRSTSSYQRSESQTKEHDICKSILRPFLHTDSIARAADPTLEFLEELPKKQEATIIRTSVYSGDAVPFNRLNPLCTESKAKNYGYDHLNVDNNSTLFKTVPEKIWGSGQPIEKCDGAFWSTAVVMSRKGPRKLETMSDARYAPIYCQTNFETFGFGDCPQGYTEYWRKERGQKFCHKFINQELKHHDADAHCQKKEVYDNTGSRVTGFADEKELELLDKMLKDAISDGVLKDKPLRVFLGCHRRTQCTSTFVRDSGSKHGYNKEANHPCSLERIFEWGHGVAQNPPHFKGHWVAKIEPNFMSDKEQCVELLKGVHENPGWPGTESSKKLNDISCHVYRYFFCGREAPIVSLGYQNQ